MAKNVTKGEAPTQVSNPFGETKAVAVPESATVATEQARAMREVEAAMAIAKRFPRDPVQSMDRILTACTRPTLAEKAMYAYPRGGELVTGPSIRLAEALAQNWGNIQFGIRELSQAKGISTVEAFAWDVETNVRITKTFQVPHVRHTRRGTYKLEDPRDIYEMIANQGARRLRACILGAIPGDVVEAALRQCELTLEQASGATEEQIKRLVQAFEKVGVTRQQIERRLGHRLDAVVTAEIVQLRKIYQSIADGMASAADFFEGVGGDAGEDPARGVDALAEALAPKDKKPARKAKTRKKVEPEAEAEPEPEPAEEPVEEPAGEGEVEVELTLEHLLFVVESALSAEDLDHALEQSKRLGQEEHEQVRVAALEKMRELHQQQEGK